MTLPQSLKVSFLTFFTLLTFVATASETLEVRAFNGESLKLSVVTIEQANTFFEYIANKTHIPHALVADGCHVRAQEMADLAAYKKIIVAKAIIEAPEGSKLLMLDDDGPWRVEWDYHIAPMVMIQSADGSSISPYIIDPALFDRPVTQQEWTDRVLRDTPQEVIARAQKYYVSRYTFTPNKRNIVYTEIPARLDRGMPSMLSVFKSNYDMYGAFYERCVVIHASTGEKTIGGLPLSAVPNSETFKPCEFAGQ